MNFKLKIYTVALALILSVNLYTQVNVVLVEPSVQKFIGDVSELDRSKYFNIHAPGNTPLLESFYKEYNVQQSGRGFYGPGIEAKKIMGEVGVYPKFNDKKSEKPKVVTRYVATEHPRNLYKEGVNVEAASDWAVNYFKNVKESNRPLWYEPMNEPFVHAKDFYEEKDWDPVAELRVKTEMSQLFKAVAKKIHADPSLKNIKVMGYGAAWPSFELKNFKNWETNMGLFLDIAGDELDAISYHLYDGVNQVGQENKRSGSNNEAIMDLIETYSYQRWGFVKPHAITEYGGIVQKEFSLINNVQSIRSQNAMIFGLLDREDRLEISIPFTTDNAKWHITKQNNYLPYKAVLWRPENMGVPKKEITGWLYTNRIQFYELWKSLKGKRVFVSTSNPDIQVQAFLDNKKLFVALNNLDDVTQQLALDLTSIKSNLKNILIKSLTVYLNDFPRYYEQTIDNIPELFSIDPAETIVMEINLKNNIPFNNKIKVRRYYNTNYLLPIDDNSPLIFEFNGVEPGVGFAKLIISLGRGHDLSKTPEVVVNGQKIEVPLNWKGYDQANRKKFFGAIEVPIPMDLILKNNITTITFPDKGGHLSSLILELEKIIK
jgi:hypothetical protein